MEQLILPKSKDLIHSEFDVLCINCICYILSIIGSTFSVIWIMMAKGSKAWYEIYERRIINIEKESALGIPQKYQMDKGAPWTLNNSLWSQEPGAYSVSKINILLGQVLRVIWVVISVIHSVLILITMYSFKEDNTSCDIILYMGAPFTILLIVTIAAQKCLTNILKAKQKAKQLNALPKNSPILFMRFLIQRTRSAAVHIDGIAVAESHGLGMLIFIGISPDDTAEDIEYLVKKATQLRIFDDEDGVMNRSILDVGGDIIAVSQFTLMAETKKGNHPSYIRAARPEVAEPLYDEVVRALEERLGRPIGTGHFGADMQVSLTNDGPVTIWIDSKARE